MNTIDATEAKNRFGTLLQEALIQPVGIRKNGRLVSVLVSIEEFNRMTSLEDAYWGERAKEAESAGFLRPEESISFIQEKMNETTPTHS